MLKIFIYSTTLIFCSMLLMAHACEDKRKEKQENKVSESNDIDRGENELPQEKMNFQFNGDYTQLWKQVDSLERKGLYKSALDRVELIALSARETNNIPSIVRSVFYKLKYNQYLAEDDLVLAINDLNNLGDFSEFPLKQIIHSIKAQVYWTFYQDNRWRFMNRTQTVGFDNTDIRTWDLNRLLDQVNKNFMLSLSSPRDLQRVAARDFKEMLVLHDEGKKERPTLYDLLAHAALDYFENTESSINRPAERFQVKGKEWFASADVYSKIVLNYSDTMSNSWYAGKILKEATAFHLRDKETEALVDLELRRLMFARNHSVEEEKDVLYISALEELSKRHEKQKVNAEIIYFRALFHDEQASKFSEEQPELRWEKKKALELCEKAMQLFPNTYGASLCKELAIDIRTKTLDFTHEITASKGAYSRILLTYKNIDQLHLKLVKVDWDYQYQENYGFEDGVLDLNKKKSVREWSVNLTNPGDFFDHTTEILLQPLELGQYVLLASNSADFSLEKNAIAYSAFWVTNMTYSHRMNNDNEYEVLVVDRDSGEPMKDVQAQVFTRKYNYNNRKYSLIKQESYKTDQNGLFTIKNKAEYRNFYIDLKKGEDQFNTLSQLYQYKPYKETKGQSHTHLFIDRAIYRPGQTIYFKGIRIRQDGIKSAPEAGKPATVVMYDVNSQKVGEVKLTTNEFGTYSGSFTIPEGLMNGSMRIQDEFGARSFFVEEYKRPKFEVDFEPVSGEFKIGQTINLEGIAKSFSGASIDGAKVKYRIVRGCSFPSWIWYRWGYQPSRGQVEIANGEVKTDEDGKYRIAFDAKEDLSIDRKYFPNYTYTVTVDVTDITGETRSATQFVVVGVNSLTLNLEIPSYFDRSELKKIKLNTMNLNGTKVSAKGNVKVTQLIQPDKFFIDSPWGRPDINGLSQEEFANYFPYEAYAKENDITNYKKGTVVLDVLFDTGKEDSISFKGSASWKAGRYLVEVRCTDAFGIEVLDQHYITVLDRKDTKNPTNDLWSFIPIKTTCEPGEKAEFLVSSAGEKLKVLFEIEHQNKIVTRDYILLDRSQKLIQIPVKEEYRGNFTVHFTVIRHGRAFSQSETVFVPFTNKQLDVQFETFRDKLVPGQKEEWKLKIKGPNGEKAVAEMLAAMYDASLDEFAANSFYLSVFGSNYSRRYWDFDGFNQKSAQVFTNDWNQSYYAPRRMYDELNTWGFDLMDGFYNTYYWADRNSKYDSKYDSDMLGVAGRIEPGSVTGTSTIALSDQSNFKLAADEISLPLADGIVSRSENQAGFAANQFSLTQDKSQLSAVKARSNMNETAFFYPQLRTDANGEISLSFTMPESLTKWKFIGMAHTKDLKTGFIQKEVVTQKELMVTPNTPRFFREGDQMIFTAKVSNLSEGDLNGKAKLLFFDAMTDQPLDSLFLKSAAEIEFKALKGQSAQLKWTISIPFGIGAVKCRVVAQANGHSDGEETTVPVLSNRMLVTESMPLPSKGKGTKSFMFDKLLASDSSSTLVHHKLTLEYSSNPAWYAVQALPYMMEYPYECAEQIFTRFYANSLATHIVASNPKIKEVFKQWENSSPEAFLSNLEKNQELKSLLLQETPWVLDAQNEQERKKRIALLFELSKMERELSKSLSKLQKMQVSNGGWPWFSGMEESRYITQHIVTGMGHLDHLGVKDVRENRSIWNMVTSAIRYLDDRIAEDYERLKKHDLHYLENQRISEIQVQYLYARSYFKDVPLNKRTEEAFAYYRTQAAKYWKNFSVYSEGMIALQAQRYEQTTLAKDIMASLKERAIVHEELGMYWKDNTAGYYWYQAPIETQALMIEAFDEITNDRVVVEELKVWLLKNKQTNDWKTTKATAEACYALFLRGTEMLTVEQPVVIRMNGDVFDPVKAGAKVEAGTGYFKTSWSGEDVNPDMAKISVERTSDGVSWGAVYWQYFEDLDKITSHETPLKLNKKLFLVENTASGPVIRPISDKTTLKPGDKVRVRIELRSDRDMEYVHMKDMRSSGFEPINVFSRYKWQDGLGYYESTGDAATNFFMDFVPKGTYVFEYDLRVTHSGEFSNGITSIQCMYAPEFTSHSEGVRVKVVE
jgi:uncharacterized protein YfaS (alpha-2-macroglobulin family)